MQMTTALSNTPNLQRFFGPVTAPAAPAAKQPAPVAYANIINWIRDKFPEIYQGLLMTRPDLTSAQMIFANTGFGDGETNVQNELTAASVFNQLLDTVKQNYPAYLQYSMQKDLIAMNIERAKQGLAPIDSSMVAPTVNVGVSSDIQRLVQFGLFGFLAIGALVVMTRKKR